MEEVQFRPILKVPFVLLRFAGMMQTKDASRLYKVCGIAFRLFAIDLFVLSQLILCFSANSILDLSDSLSVSFTYVILWLKSWSYSGNMDEILELLDEMEELMDLVQTIEKKPMEKLKPRFHQAGLFFRVFWGSCFCTTSLGALVPITTYLLNPNPPYKIPYATWFPLDIENEIVPWLFVAVYESLNGMWNCGVVSALDILPIIIFNAGAGLLEELGGRMNNIGVILEEDPQNDDKNKEANLRKLENCIEIHLRIKKFIKKSEEAFSFMIFVQGAVSLIILCTSAFSLTTISPRHEFAKFMFDVLYLFPMVLQILLPCYFGNEISVVSENLSTSLFHSDWFLQNKQFQVAMKMFMENTKRPVILSAANGFFFVNLPAFLRIMNLTYSVYALLQRMH